MLKGVVDISQLKNGAKRRPRAEQMVEGESKQSRIVVDANQPQKTNYYIFLAAGDRPKKPFRSFVVDAIKPSEKQEPFALKK
jgi:hypothetical protein